MKEFRLVILGFVMSYRSVKMDNQDIRDLIIDLKEAIEECKRVIHKSSFGDEINQLEGEISAYQDCIERLEKLNK